MTYTSVNMEINPDKLWSDMPLGAKIAGSVAAVALIGASLVASVFLAGAALFGALVMMLYSAVAGRSKAKQPVAEQSDVRHSDAEQSDIQQAR